MSWPLHPQALLDSLAQFDTPTICNSLELIDPAYRNQGFTTEPLQCIYPHLAPIVGYARTGTMRAVQGSRVSADEQKEIRIHWYKYVDEGPKPSIIVLQDLDGTRAGIGAFWGEVNTHVHRGLGAKGVVTNGSIRDIPMNASHFQLLAGSVMPSHAHVHIVSIGVPVTVAGMAVQPNDLIHADQHGAVVIPFTAAEKINDAVELIAKKEAVIIDAAKASNFSWEILRDAIKESADIH
ncbi:MenG Demethylmenaquinone methyltransferase [Burkholderiaceae bacterium]